MNRKTLLLISYIGLFLVSCSFKEEYEVYKVKDMSTSISDTLIYLKQDRVSGVEVTITGFIKGKAMLEFENGAGRFNKITLENKIDQTYRTEWYSQKLNFKYTPIENVNGDSLILRYKMY
jgi:hypothetical protein